MIVALLLVVSSAAQPAPEPIMVDCVRVAAGELIAPHLVDGATVCLGSGVHLGGLEITHSVTVKGDPGAVIDAGGRGPAVVVTGDGLTVRIEGVTLVGGHAELGAGLRVEGDSRVIVDGGGARDNHGGAAGGAGIGMVRGTLELTGGDWQDALITGFATVNAQGATFTGEVRLREEGALVCVGCRLDGGLSLRGTTTRRPSATLDMATVGVVHNDPTHPGLLIRD